LKLFDLETRYAKCWRTQGAVDQLPFHTIEQVLIEVGLSRYRCRTKI